MLIDVGIDAVDCIQRFPHQRIFVFRGHFEVVDELSEEGIGDGSVRVDGIHVLHRVVGNDRINQVSNRVITGVIFYFHRVQVKEDAIPVILHRKPFDID